MRLICLSVSARMNLFLDSLPLICMFFVDWHENKLQISGTKLILFTNSQFTLNTASKYFDSIYLW